MSDDRAEWLEWRRKHIGASDVPRIFLGLYGGPHKVWREKLGLEPPSEETEGQALGHALEDALIQIGIDRLGWGKPLRVETQVKRARGHLAATLDAVCWYDDGPRILEIKTTGHRVAQPKDEWRLQVAMQRYVTGIDRAAVVALHSGPGGLRVRGWEIGHDEELLDMVLPQLATFWDLVQSETPPAWDGTESADETLGALWPQAGESAAVLTEDQEALFMDYVAAKTAAAEAAKVCDTLAQQCKAVLGDAVTAEHPSLKIRWGNVKAREGVDAKKLREEYADVYEAVKKVGEPGRQFRVEVRK